MVGIELPNGVVASRTPNGFRHLRFMLGLIGAMLRMALVSRRAFRLASFARQLEKLEREDPFWNLVWIGVDPNHQRQGVGAALADEVIRLADTSSTRCWLVTFGPHTRGLYERRGFVVESEVQPFAQGPTGWTLRRDPRRP